MEIIAETDYFKLLEDKIGELINKLQRTKDEKETLYKTIDDQKLKINALNNELNDLKENKRLVKDRITTILEKIDKLAV